MKRQILITVFFMYIVGRLLSQANTATLFDIKSPLDIKLSLSVKEIRKSREDTLYLSHKLYYRNASGIYDSIKVGLKGRGNSRMQICYFPPLWVKIQKKDAKGTVFEGNKKVKLVVPCEGQRESNELILREYLCYKLYEIVTPYAFKTRLVNIELTERRKKKTDTWQQKGILIEDVDKTAKRFNATELNETKLSAAALHDTSALRFDMFQFMIANTDWSKGFQHNSKLIYQKPNVIPIPYDFDMSGLVDAPYAVVSQINGEQLPIESVTQRYYRGHCRSHELTEFVREEFLSREEKFLATADELKDELPAKDIEEIKDYLKYFFTILKDDDLFEREVVSRCREL